MINKTAILINVKDRPTELALALQSLRTQTFQEFDIFVLDDCSGTPLQSYHFLNCLTAMLKLEDHHIFFKRTEFTHGVSRARQAIVDWCLETYDYEYLCRLDDDCIFKSNYLEKLFEVINKGYDLASGVTIPCGPVLKRNTKYISNQIVNRVILDDEGNYIMNGDDCGMPYVDEKILPAHHFRSCALYKSSIHTKHDIKYYPTRLSMHGFREEQFLSYKILMAGLKIGVNTGAINYHQMTPSGGERPTQNMTQFNQDALIEYTKNNKDKLKKLFPNEPMPTELELLKETNLK